MSEETHQESFWITNGENSTEVLAYVEHDPKQVANELFNLRLQTTCQANAIAHLTACAWRACAARNSAREELAGERIEIQRCEKTIADLRAEVERLKTKRVKK